jgi:hypothetical protein
MDLWLAVLLLLLLQPLVQGESRVGGDIMTAC